MLDPMLPNDIDLSMDTYILFRIGFIHSHRTTLVIRYQAYVVMQCTQSVIIEQNAIDSVSQPQLVKAPTWLRVLQVSTGAISIILSGYVLAQPSLTIFTAVRILSIVLLFVGIESTVVGTFSRSLRTSSRFSNIALGALAIAFSFLGMALLPPPPILFSIFLGDLPYCLMA
jgi:hypothetical protein